jgi:CheY-like chemotaxis protein/class 3 adenylate cyclase
MDKHYAIANRSTGRPIRLESVHYSYIALSEYIFVQGDNIMTGTGDGSANTSRPKYLDRKIVSNDGLFDELQFSADVKKCCVSFVDMVHSTEIIARISDPARVRKYYSIFINTIAAIAKSFDAKIIKNTGDCLIHYFPKTFDYSNSSAFQDVIECGLAMVEASSSINVPSTDYKLPAINYRISADYGSVQMTRSITSATNDLFGQVISLCSKMNSLASPNGMVIGNNLHQIIKNYYSDNYDLEMLKGSDLIDAGEIYNIYAVSPKNRNIAALRHDIALSKIESFEKPKLSASDRLQGKELRHNILIVDDEPDALFTYKTFLASEGYNVDAFTVPEEALIRFRSRTPSYYSLVIADIRMPRLNGLQFYHQLKRISMSVKVLFVSALDAAGELVSILPNTSDIGVLKKPADQQNFMAAVRGLLKYNI